MCWREGRCILRQHLPRSGNRSRRYNYLVIGDNGKGRDARSRHGLPKSHELCQQFQTVVSSNPPDSRCFVTVSNFRSVTIVAFGRLTILAYAARRCLVGSSTEVIFFPPSPMWRLAASSSSADSRSSAAAGESASATADEPLAAIRRRSAAIS